MAAIDDRALSIAPGRIAVSGPLILSTVGALWGRGIAAAVNAGDGKLTIDVSAADRIDTSGVSFLLALEQAHGNVAFEGLNAQCRDLIERLRCPLAIAAHHPEQPRPNKGDVIHHIIDRFAFLGETILALAGLPRDRRFLRGADFARIADMAGVQALPLIVVLGLLIGMILAFQSAIPMRQFGVELFVADLVAISLFRELGPLMCAVILAGRTGSAFAAELGTMQVNEEIAALRTMGIDPATRLALPRMASVMLVMPVLTIAMDVSGLVGMAAVLVSSGYPLAEVSSHVLNATKMRFFVLGLVKSVVFGAIVSLIGCRAGLTAGFGPRAVGEAATSAVVGGIVATIVFDGIFAVLTYRLGI